MGKHLKVAVNLIVVGFLVIAALKFLLPIFSDYQQQDTSDAKSTKGSITIGYDNWVGYFPLCSPEMKKRMRQSGYNLKCIDDNADYKDRYQKLARGTYDFAVGTVDSYILNGDAEDYPGVITSVIDESKGGDAIVSWGNVVTSLDDLKTNKMLRVAYTPESPSEHLLKALSSHFGIPKFSKPVLTDGSDDALNKLLSKEVDVAILWEPSVSKALAKKGIKKLISTEDTNQLIVDILIANRKVASRKPEMLNMLHKQYFKTLKFYRDNEDRLIKDVSKSAGVSKKQALQLLQGVKWATLTDNAQRWFGVDKTAVAEEALIETIDSTIEVLLEYGSFSKNPIPNNNSYRITYSDVIKTLYDQTGRANFSNATNGKAPEGSLTKEFTALNDNLWENLIEVGTLRVRPIVFSSGTSSLTIEGKTQLDSAAENLKHYPNYRLEVHGHTGLRGLATTNTILSKERAEAISRYMNVTYGVDIDRIRSIGFGSKKPLARNPGESSRAYNYRLPRVELKLVAEDL